MKLGLSSEPQVFSQGGAAGAAGQSVVPLGPMRDSRHDTYRLHHASTTMHHRSALHAIHACATTRHPQAAPAPSRTAVHTNASRTAASGAQHRDPGRTHTCTLLRAPVEPSRRAAANGQADHVTGVARACSALGRHLRWMAGAAGSVRHEMAAAGCAVLPLCCIRAGWRCGRSGRAVLCPVPCHRQRVDLADQSCASEKSMHGVREGADGSGACTWCEPSGLALRATQISTAGLP